MNTWVLSFEEDLRTSDEKWVRTSNQFDQLVFLHGMPNAYVFGEFENLYECIKATIEGEMWNIEAYQYERPLTVEVRYSSPEIDKTLSLMKNYFKDHLIIKDKN